MRVWRKVGLVGVETIDGRTLLDCGVRSMRRVQISRPRPITTTRTNHDTEWGRM